MQLVRSFLLVVSACLVSCAPKSGSDVSLSSKDLLGGHSLEKHTTGGDSGTDQRSLRLLVNGIHANAAPTRLCYAINAPAPTAAKTLTGANVKCVDVAAQKTSAEIVLSGLSPSVYVVVFHDENQNSKLDFTVMNLIVDRREAIAEGYAFVEDPASAQTEAVLRRLIILPAGETKIPTTLVYGRSAMEGFLVEKAWEQAVNQAQQVYKSLNKVSDKPAGYN